MTIVNMTLLPFFLFLYSCMKNEFSFPFEINRISKRISYMINKSNYELKMSSLHYTPDPNLNNRKGSGFAFILKYTAENVSGTAKMSDSISAHRGVVWYFPKYIEMAVAQHKGRSLPNESETNRT